ncbi:hypothetical protein CTAYLR_010323 [Chrysophaeum taylorii]|uniref:Uncharacterized protein n=1 Tax=Chrysophaeum taylorii TaxID=2483200 RepID=A0AAD7XKG5_9STRA|nr:hypothetical protein CTAYLR_010323 [Chrysophaeum taylorii]
MAALASTMARDVSHHQRKGYDRCQEERLGEEEPHLVRTLRGHRGGVTSISFSPTKRQIASGGMDACVMLWQFGSDGEGSSSRYNRGPPASSSSPSERPTRAFRFAGHRGPVHRVAFSPDGSQLASASADRCVRLWQPTARGGSTEVKGHSAAVRSVDYAPDGCSLMTASDDKTVKIWALPSKKFVCTLGAAASDERGGGSAAQAHANWVRCARWSPDGRVAASCGDDKLVKLWDVEARRCARTFYDHEGGVRDVAFSSDGTCVVSAGEDRKINVWDARSYALLQHYAAHDALVTSLAFDASGRYLASTGLDGVLKLYDLRQGQLLYTLRGHKGAVGCSAFAPPRGARGDVFASGGADRVVMIWRARLDGCVDDDLPVVAPPAQRPQSAPSARKQATADTKTRTSFERADTKTRTSFDPPPPPSIDRYAPPEPPSKPFDGTATHGVDVVLEDFVAAAEGGQRRSGGEGLTAPPEPRRSDDDLAWSPDAGTSPPARSFPNLETVARRGDPLPEAVAATFDHVIGQLSVITSTLGMLEQRLAITENRVAALTFAGERTKPLSASPSEVRPDPSVEATD